MSPKERVRNWMKIPTTPLPVNRELWFRRVTSDDAVALALLMDRAYRGTIDHEGESPAQCLEEMHGTVTGKYGPFLDGASFVITEGQNSLSASLVTFWKEKPLLAFSMTDPSAQNKGYSKFLIERSISALAEAGYSQLFLVVTEGNSAAERLYDRIGFIKSGPTRPKEFTSA